MKDAREARSLIDRIEIVLWISLLGFGSWVAFAWLTDEPLAKPAPLAEFPSDFLEAEQLGVRARTRRFTWELTKVSGGAREGWSGDEQMQAWGALVGDSLDLGLPRRYPGRYRLWVYLTRAPEHGIVAFALNDQRIGEAIDLHRDGSAVPTGPISLGIGTLKGRGDRLRIEVMGAGGGGAGGLDFALDGIRIEKIELFD